MLNLTLALHNALTSLNVNQRAMAVISHNIANANTEGYSRQVLDLASVTYDGGGQGVRIEGVERKVDEFLLNSINRQNSHVGEAEMINEYMDRVQVLLGDPGSGNTIDAQIQNFFNDLQAMAETPERTSTRTAVVQSGVNLAREVSNMAYGLEGLRYQADTEIANGVKTINEALRKLATINEAIAHADAFRSPKATLFDQRDKTLKTLTGMMDLRTNQLENGVTHIYVGQGVPLLDESLHELSYARANSLETFVNDSNLNPIYVYELRPDGQRTGTDPLVLATSGTSAEVTSILSTGKLAALMDIRDTTLPDMLEQLDTLASVLRDTFNAIHNDGSGFPAAAELKGTREIIVSERIAWEGQVRIAALDIAGLPAASEYADEAGGLRPLTLNLDTIYNGINYGEPSTQDIIKEINNHFGIPQNRVTLGNLNQIQLAISSDNIPGASSNIIFDFDLENISNEQSDFWVSGIQVLDDNGANITSYTDTMPAIDLAPVNTFNTTAASDLVQINTASAHGLQVGDRIKLSDPGVPVDVIPGAQFDDYFVIQAVTSTSFTIQLPTTAVTSTNVTVAAQTAQPPYGTVETGEKKRLQPNGSITADVSGNPGSRFYDVTATMTVRDESGTLSFADVTYRIYSPGVNTRNSRISGHAIAAGSATLVQPQTTQSYLKAILVDSDGNELPAINGEYGDQSGYLKIVSYNEDRFRVAIDELNSGHLGLPSDVPPRPGSNRGFSFFYELNNFFASNEPTDTGDTRRNSAYNMAIERRLIDTPNLVSTGNLELSNQPADTALGPRYTYERFSGDNSIAQDLARAGLSAHVFSAAGGLSQSSLTLNGYAGEMLGYITAQTSVASTHLENQQILMKGYQERAQAISGVNIDEELGNTIIYQHAYSASAKVITTTDELFRALLEAV